MCLDKNNVPSKGAPDFAEKNTSVRNITYTMSTLLPGGETLQAYHHHTLQKRFSAAQSPPRRDKWHQQLGTTRHLRGVRRGRVLVRSGLTSCCMARLTEMEWRAAGKKPEPQLTGGWPKLQGQRNYPRTPKKITTWEVLP